MLAGKQPFAGLTNYRELLDKLSPSMQVVSGDAAKFDHALADYRQVVDQCEVRAP